METESKDVLRCASCGRVPKDDEPTPTTGLEGCKGCGSRCFELVTLPKSRQSAADTLFDLGIGLMRLQHAQMIAAERKQ